MFRTCIGRTRGRALRLSAAPLAAASMVGGLIGGLIWDGSHAPAAAQGYNGGPNQVIVNMDVLNALPGAYGTPAQTYGQAPKSQFLPGLPPQTNAAPAPIGQPANPVGSPVGAPRYLPPYTPYGVATAGSLPLAPGLSGLAVPPSRSPSSVLTTLGPDGRPIQPIKLTPPGSDTRQATATKTKTAEDYAAPAQPAPASAPEPAPEMAAETPAEPTGDEVAAVEPPTPPAEPADVPDTVPMPEATPAPSASGAIVETAPVVEAPEPPAEDMPAEPVEEQVAAPEAPAPEAPAEDAAEATAEERPAEETATEEAAADEATETAEAEPDNSAPAAPIPQGGIRIVFPTEVNEVPVEANAALDDLASQMLADEEMRIQIMCYASGDEETSSKARRKSLARCINIRQYLFKKDVRTTRMDVRALGLKSEGQPADRVDIVPASS